VSSDLTDIDSYIRCRCFIYWHTALFFIGKDIGSLEVKLSLLETASRQTDGLSKRTVGSSSPVPFTVERKSNGKKEVQKNRFTRSDCLGNATSCHNETCRSSFIEKKKRRISESERTNKEEGKEK
jgi:hypothetical protein